MGINKILIKFFLFFFLSAFLPCRAFAEIHATQDFSLVYYHVEGNKSSSFYPSNDADYLYEGSIDFKHMLKDDEIFGNLEYRLTDDRLVDVQDISIERMYMGLKGQAKEFLVGDFYSNFSEYSLSNALKGVKLSFGDEKSSRLTLVGGADFSKWEDLWEKRWEDSSAFKYVWGARLENNLLNNKLALNFNYGGAKDDDAHISSSSSPLLVNVFSVDGKYLINNYFTLTSELAQSYVDEDARKDEVKTKSDRAMKCVLDFNVRDYTLASTYSRVGSHFATTGGFTAQDLETINFDGTWFMPLKIKFNHYLHTDKDNLSNTKATTTKQLNPGGKFSLTLPADFSLDLGADLRKRFSTDKTTNAKTYAYNLNLNRDFRIFYSSLGYTKTIVSDRVSPSSERNTDAYSLGLDGNFSIKDVKFTWNFAEDISHVNYKEVCEADFTASTNIGLKLAFPSTLAFEARVSFSDNDYYLNETDSGTTQYYFSVCRNLKDNLVLDATYERKSYNYYGGDNNYAENVLKGKLSYKF